MKAVKAVKAAAARQWPWPEVKTHVSVSLCVCVVWEVWKGEVLHGITHMNNTRWPKLAAWLGSASRAVCVWAAPRGEEETLGETAKCLSFLSKPHPGREGSQANGEPQMCKRYSYFFLFSFSFRLCFLSAFWQQNCKYFQAATLSSHHSESSSSAH